MKDIDKIIIPDEVLSEVLHELGVDGTEVLQKTSDKVSETIWDEKKCFLVEQHERLQEIEEKFKQLEQQKEEKQRLIPEMDSSFWAKICLERLSKILTDDELEFVRKWRTKQDLRSIYELTWSFRDEIAKKVLARLKDLSDDEKLVFGDYLCKQRIIFWCFDFGIWYYYTDGLYEDLNEVYSVLGMLWLEKYVSYEWDLCYHIEWDILKSAAERVFDKTLWDGVLSVKDEVKKIDEEIEKLSIETEDVFRKIEAVSCYWLPVEHSLSVLDRKESVDWRIVSTKTIDDKKVYVILTDYSYYPWWWCWMEYWVKLYVKRWSQKDMDKIVYRHPRSSYYDDWSKAYTMIDKVEVLDDKVLVTVSKWPNTRADTYTFQLEKQDWELDEKLLSAEEQQKFKERVEEEKKRLLKLETRENGRMRSYHDLVYMEMPHPRDYEMMYDRAEIVDEHMSLWNGVYVMVIKTQIDSRAGEGKQFAWLKYKITPEQTVLVERKTLWQSELMAWKHIDMHAED